MNLSITNRRECPPDGYRFTHPEDGHISRAIDLDSWFAAILKHKRDNGYDVPDDWKAIAEDQLCRLLPPGWCHYGDGTTPEAFIDARIGLDEIVNGTRVLVDFVLHGAKPVNQELAESRAATCAACYAKVQVQGCAPCRGVANLVEDAVGGKKTKADAQLSLYACGVCRCVARAQIWVGISSLAKGMTPAMDTLWPEFCWKKKERDAMELA